MQFNSRHFRIWWHIYKFRMSNVNNVAPEIKPMSIDIGGMRIKYKDASETFTERDLICKEPIGQFKCWFDEACKNSAILEPNAMCLSTATKDGCPSGRFVLLKGYGTDGFKFFTNYDSRKGQELAENPRAALTFFWQPQERSVRVEGSIEKLSQDEADQYFNSRPLQSRIGAALSQQSVPVPSRETLSSRARELQRQYGDGVTPLPRPLHWGGYIVVPHSVEFWQGQTDRVHDRIRFRRPNADECPDGILLHSGDLGWVYERLSP